MVRTMKSYGTMLHLLLLISIMTCMAHTINQRFVFDESEVMKLEESKVKQVQDEKKEKIRTIKTQELVELIKQDIATPIEPFDGEVVVQPIKRRTIAHVPLKNVNNVQYTGMLLFKILDTRFSTDNSFQNCKRCPCLIISRSRRSPNMCCGSSWWSLQGLE